MASPPWRVCCHHFPPAFRQAACLQLSEITSVFPWVFSARVCTSHCVSWSSQHCCHLAPGARSEQPSLKGPRVTLLLSWHSYSDFPCSLGSETLCASFLSVRFPASYVMAGVRVMPKDAERMEKPTVVELKLELSPSDFHVLSYLPHPQRQHDLSIPTLPGKNWNLS